jgi:hypothetical protein
MARYLISFDRDAMDHIRDEEGRLMARTKPVSTRTDYSGRSRGLP